MNSDLTFVFDNDGKAHAMKEGKVVASADSVEELETLVREAAPAPQAPAPQPPMPVDQQQQQAPATPPATPIVNPPGTPGGIPNQVAPPGTVMAPNTPIAQGQVPQQLMSAKDCDCWDGYDRVPGTKPCSKGSCKKCDDHRSKKSAMKLDCCDDCGKDVAKGDGVCSECKDSQSKNATHVITPNGLKGRILGKTKDIWGDTVTVRFENGRIVQFPVSDEMRYASEKEEALSVTASLRERLNASTDGDRDSLIARVGELKSIRREAQVKIANDGASFADEAELDNISVEAGTELNEVVAALDHINDETTEAYRPPTMHVAEQASLGGNDGTWLDDTFSNMVSEANHTDYDKLMSEGPEAFVAELETPALADSGVTREMASSHIRSKTAGANPDARDSFETAWIDRVETLRRKEILNRKTKAKKEAAAETDHSNLPDDILFG